jgi:hypothetical protein
MTTWNAKQEMRKEESEHLNGKSLVTPSTSSILSTGILSGVNHEETRPTAPVS